MWSRWRRWRAERALRRSAIRAAVTAAEQAADAAHAQGRGPALVAEWIEEDRRNAVNGKYPPGDYWISA